MIDGYELLNENIESTTSLIDIVSSDTEQQRVKIEDINSDISVLDKMTQENAKIASATHLVAQQASDIAQKIVNDAKGKDFNGKEGIKVRENIIDPFFEGKERRRIEKGLKVERKGTKADRKS